MISVHNVSHGTDEEQDVRVKVRGGNNDILRPGERNNYPEVDNLNELSTHCAVFRNGQQILESNLIFDRQGPQSDDEEAEESDVEQDVEEQEGESDEETDEEIEEESDDDESDVVETEESDYTVEESDDQLETSDDLEDLSYDELQDKAKELDIPANQSTEDLIDAIQEEQ